MSITFEVIEDKKYFISTWTGRIKDDEILHVYESFYHSAAWSKDYSELVNLSDAHLSHITAKGMIAFSAFVERVFVENDVLYSKTAIYCPGVLPTGLAKIYRDLTSQSPESVRLFKGLSEAKKWLVDETKN